MSANPFQVGLDLDDELFVNRDGQRTTVKLGDLFALLRRSAGEFAVEDFGAVGDGVTDCTVAFRGALAAAVAAGGRVTFGAGTYVLSDDLVIDGAVCLQGAGARTSFLSFPAGKRIWVKYTGAGGRAIKLEHFRYLGVNAGLSQWQATHTYAVGDRVRSVLGTLDAASLTGQHDAGLHFVCTSATGNRKSGSSEPAWSSLPGDTFTDGDLVWTVEDWSAISVESSFVTISHVDIGPVTDCGVFSHGTVTFSDPAISDGTTVDHCSISGGQGHGLYFVGSDAQLNLTMLNDIENFTRGAGIWDAGSFTSSHIGNQVVGCRASFLSTGTFATVAWMGNYHENCDVGFRVSSAGVWLNGTGNASAHNASRGYDVNGVLGDMSFSDDNDPPWTRSISGEDVVFRSGDILLTTTAWDAVTDPGGRWGPRFSNANFDAYHLSGARSTLGPNRFILPTGFFLGTQAVATSDHPPSSSDLSPAVNRLWNKGDIVTNTDTGASEPLFWRAAAAGGWGGGRFRSARAWASADGVVGVGEGIEPSSANTYVYRATRFEVKVDGVWVTDNRLYQSLSSSEPTWPVVVGNTVTELVDSTHRIVWTCHGNVGMSWEECGVRSGTVTT